MHERDHITQHSVHGVEAEPAPINLVALAYRSLRGRIMVTLLLTAALATAGVWAGYTIRKPVYTSTGIVRVAPTLPKIMYDSEQNQLMPLFDSYVSSQATFMASHPVLRKTVDDLNQRDIDWAKGTDGIKALARALDVQHEPRSELIKISVKHHTPAVAQSAVNAVIETYEQTWRDDGAEL